MPETTYVQKKPELLPMSFLGVPSIITILTLYDNIPQHPILIVKAPIRLMA